VTIAIVALVLLRWGWTSMIGQGASQSLTSPSLFYTAHAAQWSGVTFFGTERHRQDLWITDAADRIVWATTLEGHDLDFSLVQAVEWQADSSIVVFRGVGDDGTIAQLAGPEFASVKSVEQVIEEAG
jgi:hypothetical protein